MKQVSEKVVSRLIIYRKYLKELLADGQKSIFSHKISAYTGASAAQVRRDLMNVGYNGTPVKGYNIKDLMTSISEFLEKENTIEVAIVGFGNLGKSIVDYCNGRNSRLSISAAFDTDPNKINRVIHGCHCYANTEMETIIKENKVEVAILAVPREDAQKVADKLVACGIKGILNYSPTRLQVPANIYVENRDMLMALEKVAYFANNVHGGKNK
jgi:redox-sensing transcriptional repressor